MPKFNVFGSVTVSCATVVEADSPEQAVQIAKGREMAELPAVVFNGYPIEETWHFENDGVPEVVRVEQKSK